MTARRLLLLCAAAGLVPACEPAPLVDVGTDAAPEDAAGDDVLDAPRDAVSLGPGLPAQRAALADYVAAFCACLPLRNPEISEPECLAASAPDAQVSGCEEAATTAIGTAFDAYYRCRAAAFEALAECSSECTASAVAACNGEFQTAATACNGMLPATSVVQAYLAVYQACIVENVTGAMASCPDDPSLVSSALGEAVFSGTTALSGNDSEPLLSCFDEPASMMDAIGAPDRSFRWAAPAAGSYRIDTIGSDFDTILYLRSACTDALDVACSDDVVLGVERASCVTFAAADGEELVIVVDGFGDLTRGEFVVNIAADATCPGPPLPDAGVPDGGASDAGASDAGASDAGIDAPL